MTPEMSTVFLLLGLLIVLFALDKIRLDLVALLGVSALMVGRLLSPEEALAGFSDPLVVSICGLFVIGGGLMQTGVADYAAAKIRKVAGNRISRLRALLMVGAALMSAFMSSTGTVAILLPAVVSLARGAGVAPSRLLLPLAHGTLMGGLLTLIAQPPNLVVSRYLESQGRPPFSFFIFTPIGLLLLLGAVAFHLVLGDRLLPDRTPRHQGQPEATEKIDLDQEYGLENDYFQLRVPASSPASGQTLAQLDIGRRFAVTVIGGTPETQLEAEQSLQVQGSLGQVLQLTQELGLELSSGSGRNRLSCGQLQLAELLLTPRSALLGKTLCGTRFRDRYGVSVLAIKRKGRVLPREEFRQLELHFGDTLLLVGPTDRFQLLRGERRNFVVVAESLPEEPERLSSSGWLALAWMVAMLLAITLNWLPMVAAILLAALGMIFSRCLTAEEAYRAISWESVVLIAGMLPMATALEKTGGTDYLAGLLFHWLQGAGPGLAMLAIYLTTNLLSQFLSNTAATVLMAPLAFRLSLSLGLSPEGTLMLVAVAACSTLLTPMATPVNSLIMGPGGYRFGDYARVGLPLQAVLLLLTMLIVPRLFG